MATLILFALLATATLGALVWSGIELFRAKEDPLAGRLEELQAYAIAGPARTQQQRRRGGGFLNNVLYVISLFPGGEGWLHDTERELAQAGRRQKTSLAIFALVQYGFLGTLLTLALWAEWNAEIVQKMIGVVAALMLGWLLPQQLLHATVRRYRRKLQEALPDSVDLLGIVLGTGLALDQAMFRVSEELQFIYPELASEFSTLVMQVRAGQERAKAFQQLVRRTGIEDIKSLAAMIVQSERFGTSLSMALKVYADSLRERRQRRVETVMARAGIKMLFPIILFILPALFVITLVPGLLSVLQQLKEGLGPR